MTLNEVMQELHALSDPQTKKTLMRHGAKEPFYGVKVGEMKKILKKTKKNHELSLQLYATGNSDAMYLAGLMADEHKITKEQLEEWVKAAYWSYLSEFAVPWVASETPYGIELGLKWIDSKEETIASAGWQTLSSCATVMKDEELDEQLFSKLLDRVAKDIHSAQNRVRYTMNNFVIACACSIISQTTKAKETAKIIGAVTVEVDGTACKVPLAVDYIEKNISTGRIGYKKKTARC
jgi:3-methyladenine DNA glycosylase AlkD